MRSFILAACLAVAAVSTASVTPAQAEVDIRVPGVRIESGRDHRDEWRRHEEWRQHERYERHCERWDCRR